MVWITTVCTIHNTGPCTASTNLWTNIALTSPNPSSGPPFSKHPTPPCWIWGTRGKSKNHLLSTPHPASTGRRTWRAGPAGTATMSPTAGTGARTSPGMCWNTPGRSPSSARCAPTGLQEHSTCVFTSKKFISSTPTPSPGFQGRETAVRVAVCDLRLMHRVIILIEKACLHNRIEKTDANFLDQNVQRHSVTSLDATPPLANGPIVAGGWGGIPRQLQRLQSLIGYGALEESVGGA